MRGMNNASVDLIYLDPPFNSKSDYAAPIGSKAAGAEFKDTWTLRDVDNEWINLIEVKHPKLYRVLLAAMTNSNKSYLAYMAVRLLEMKRILKETGSIYLHCDPTMSHYLKAVMDAIFGVSNFRNEIVWCYRGMTPKSKRFNAKHDVILFYSKTDNFTFNELRGEPTAGSKKAYESAARVGYLANHKRKMVVIFDEQKYRKAVSEGKIPEGMRESYFDGGRPRLNDWWADIKILGGPGNKERTDYPTQKPLALLKRIIEASSKDGDMVLDPFAGCATACIAAEQTGRQWVGIDIGEKAAYFVKTRMQDELRMFYQGTHREDIPLRTDLGKLPAYNCKENKWALYKRQEGHCAGCKDEFKFRNFEVDHIIAKSNGGTDHLDNLQLLCGYCNKVKGDRGQPYLMAKLQLVRP